MKGIQYSRKNNPVDQKEYESQQLVHELKSWDRRKMEKTPSLSITGGCKNLMIESLI